MSFTPRPWQAKSAPHLIDCIQRHGAAADLSDPGTGKTYTGCMVVKELDRPTLVVAPKAVLPAWHKVASVVGTELDALNYEMLRTGNTPYGEWGRTGRQRVDRFHWNSAIKFLIFDEAHRCAGWKSIAIKNAEGKKIGSRLPLQSEMLMAAKRQGIPTMLLTATLADSPLELKAAGYALGLHDGDERNDSLATFHKRVDPFFNWARRHGCGRGAWSDLEFNGTAEKKIEVMQKIHAAIIPNRGVRIRIAELGDAFPETQISAELYEAGSPAKVDALYREMADALRELEEHAADDKAPEAPFVKLLRARQEVELIKVPIFVELAQDAMAQGQRVAIFVNFTQTLQEICKRLKTDCFVDGSQVGEAGARRRQANVDAFQADREPVIVCNGDAGGVGISLHGLNRLALISPGYSAKVLRQILGRVWRSGGGKSLQRIICLADTVEVGVQKSVSAKTDRLDALCDGDLMP